MAEKLSFLFYDKNSKVVDKIDERNFLNLGKESGLSRIDLYLYAMAQGKHAGSKLSKKDSLVRGEYVERKIEAIPLITALYIGSKNEFELSKLAKNNKMFEYADECANTGFSAIEQMMESMSPENLELNIIKQLDEIYEDNVRNSKLKSKE
jgi:hypothetical protein